MDVICQTLAFMLHSRFWSVVFYLAFSSFQPISFSYSYSRALCLLVTFFLRCQHYYCIHIRIVFSVNERTSFIINKMLMCFFVCAVLFLPHTFGKSPFVLFLCLSLSICRFHPCICVRHELHKIIHQFIYSVFLVLFRATLILLWMKFSDFEIAFSIE